MPDGRSDNLRCDGPARDGKWPVFGKRLQARLDAHASSEHALMFEAELPSRRWLAQAVEEYGG